MLHALDPSQVVDRDHTLHLVVLRIDHVVLYQVVVVSVDHLEALHEVQAQGPVLLEAVYHEEVHQDHHLAVHQVQDEINR